ncbi:hypothetical protein B296_00029378 [Ensete ventricosum]|uniref:Uncharacterized protein n=1 Tax=Ensete ventricosum TaxID=4639 RepID=A0A426ZXB8_ENSVE|nr:hypothetical protein B296_00029378 [Ensete ventricosum]
MENPGRWGNSRHVHGLVFSCCFPVKENAGVVDSGWGCRLCVATRAAPRHRCGRFRETGRGLPGRFVCSRKVADGTDQN